MPNSPDEAPLSVDMMLERGRVVVGRVVDIDGHPVAGAAILLAENAGGTRVVEVTQSDREGRYRVQLSGSQDIAARKDGHVDSWTYTTFGNTTPEMTLEIPLRGPAARVEGIVTDVDGNAIAGAQVLIGQERRSTIGRIVEAPQPFHARSAPPARILTDAHGRFVVNTLPPDRTLVAVRALGFAPWSEHRAFTAGRTTDLELRLERGARVRGMVTDALGKPVAGALILQGERYGCFLGNQSRTDTNGRFEITSLPIGTFSLSASSKNVGRVHRIFETVGAGEEFEWHPFLGAGPGISGRLADASGKALTDWSISLLFPIDDYNERGLDTTTNDGGVFHFRDVGKREYRLEVRGPRARFVSAVRDGISASSAPLSLRLTEEQMPLSTIRGKIELGDGGDAKTLTLLKSEDKTLFGGHRTTVVKDGLFEEHGLVPGTYVLALSTKQERQHLATVQVRARQDVDLGTITIPITRSIEVVLHEGGDKAHQPAKVFVCDETGQSVHGKTKRPGPGRTSEIGTGPFVVMAEHDGVWYARRVNIDRDMRKIEIRAAEGTTHDFTIEDPRAQNFEVRIADEHDRLWFFRSVGRVFALNLPACDARVSTFVHPRRSARTRIALGDEPRQISIELR